MRVLCTTAAYGLDEINSEIELIKNPYGPRLSEMEVSELIKKHKPVGMIA